MKYAFVLFSVLLFFAAVSKGRIAAQDAPVFSDSRYFVKISHSQCRLWLYEKTGEGLKFVREYRAGTVKVGLKKFPLGLGYITNIDFTPVWQPTAYTRWYFAKRKGINLPESVPFGHPLNYMGSFRISLSHNVPGKGAIYRIHGVRSGEEHFVGTRVSGGCIRMLNEEGLEVSRKVSIGTPVEIIP